ncbi:hypothetical protein EV361DRAFT_1029496, partial [Lentinula raphanica]
MSYQSNTIPRAPDVITLYPPECGYEYAEIFAVLRNKIMLYDNAPHGFYLAPKKPGGKQYLFKFVNGKSALQAYHDVSQLPRNSDMLQWTSKTQASHLNTLNLKNQQFNPLPMKTGQQLYNSGSSINYLPQMQSSRMAGPHNNTRRDAAIASHSIHQKDENALLPLGEINIKDNLPESEHSIFYFLEAATNFDFPLIQARSSDSWLFAKDVEFIKDVVVTEANGTSKEVYVVEHDWPQELREGQCDFEWPKRVNPRNPINRWSTPKSNYSYGSDSYVVVKHAPKHPGVDVTLHGWDWHKKAPSKQGFKMHNGFDIAVAANEIILRDQYDGNIGLGPKQDKQNDIG